MEKPPIDFSNSVIDLRNEEKTSNKAAEDQSNELKMKLQAAIDENALLKAADKRDFKTLNSLLQKGVSPNICEKEVL